MGGGEERERRVEGEQPEQSPRAGRGEGEREREGWSMNNMLFHCVIGDIKKVAGVEPTYSLCLYE